MRAKRSSSATSPTSRCSSRARRIGARRRSRWRIMRGMSEHITVERRGHLLLVGLNPAHTRNAFHVGMFTRIGRAGAELDGDDALRAGVLFAHGDHFTGGLDLAEWAPIFASG